MYFSEDAPHNIWSPHQKALKRNTTSTNDYEHVAVPRESDGALRPHAAEARNSWEAGKNTVQRFYAYPFASVCSMCIVQFKGVQGFLFVQTKDDLGNQIDHQWAQIPLPFSSIWSWKFFFPLWAALPNPQLLRGRLNEIL